MNHFYMNESFGEDWFTYPQLYQTIVQRFPSGSHFVEVGCWKGKSAAFMAVEIENSGKKIQFDCIDIWDVSPNNGERSLSGDELFNCFKNNIEPVSHIINVKRMDSSAAADDYADNSVDFVFIDADHSYEGVKRDILAWLPKVKQGGVFAGHDYWHPPINAACNDIFGHGNYADPWGNGCYIIEVNWK